MNAPTREPRAMSDGVKLAVAVIIAFTLVLGLLGMIVSFASITKTMRGDFGQLAPLVALGIDLGIGIFSALVIVLALLDLGCGWLRIIPGGLIAATIYLNVSAGHTLPGRIAHGVMPGLFVAVIEVAYFATSTRVGLASGSRIEKARRSRWVLAPVGTARLRRRQILWEEPSYRAAVDREAARLVAVAALRIEHGRLWRFKAPLADRLALKLDGLTAEGGSRLLERIKPVEVPRPPAPKIPRPGTVKVPRAKAAPAMSEVALLAAAKAVNEAAIKSTGKPAGVPRLAAELGIGKPRATLLRDLLAAQGAHVNGTPVPAGATASTTIPQP